MRSLNFRNTPFIELTEDSTAMAKSNQNRKARTARPRNARMPSNHTSGQSDESLRTSGAALIRISESMIDLQSALFAHPQFNKAAPQESPQVLFYVMDFLIRTMREYLMRLDPDLINSGDEVATERYTDALSRNGLLSMIITDKSGKSKMFGKSEESDFEFGAEIEAKAKAMIDISFGKDGHAEDDENNTNLKPSDSTAIAEAAQEEIV